MTELEPVGGRPVALVTGSRGAIGRAVVTALSEEGMQVVGVDVTPELGGEAAVELRADVSARDDCIAAVRETLERMLRLDVVICASGINLRQPFESMDFSQARGLFDVNVWGAVNIILAAHEALFQSPCASVVAITSTSGQLGFRNSSAYAMSKTALTGLVRSLAVEWAPYGVRVNAVAPAIVPTPMNAEVRQQEGYLEAKLRRIPLGRMIETREVADTVAFLAGSRSSGITGTTINVDGGAAVMG